MVYLICGPEVALFKWLSSVVPGGGINSLIPLIEELGFKFQQSVSTKYHLYAIDPPEAKVKPNARVSILISCDDKDLNRVAVEVRSGEAMLKKGTRCEFKAKLLRVHLPAL